MGWRHTDAETPVRRGADGQFYVAAQDVTAILRDMARTFDLHAQAEGSAWTAGDRTIPVRLDEDTMRTVAGILRAQADEMDDQLTAIAASSTTGTAGTPSAWRQEPAKSAAKGRGRRKSGDGTA